MNQPPTRRRRNPALAVASAAVALLAFGVGVVTLAAVGFNKPHVSAETTKAGPVEVSLTEFAITGPHLSAPAGDVTFKVTNNGHIDHEMLVLKTDLAPGSLPITDGGDPPVPVTTGANKIDEGPSVGETGDPNLKPGETRTFTIKKLTPGHYVLVCNLASHYGMGMRTAFTVTP